MHYARSVKECIQPWISRSRHFFSIGAITENSDVYSPLECKISMRTGALPVHYIDIIYHIEDVQAQRPAPPMLLSSIDH
jgi:hypothetical protein